MGFDAFGLSENYAIKTGIHPKDSTLKNIETMEAQLKAMELCSIGKMKLLPVYRILQMDTMGILKAL